MSKTITGKLAPVAGFFVPPAVAFMLAHWFFGVREFMPVIYAFDTVPVTQAAVIDVVALAVSGWLFFRKKLDIAGRCFWPALFFYPLSLLPHDFYALSAVFFVAGWCVYHIPFRRIDLPIPERIGWIAAGLCGVTAGTWSFLLLSNAYRTRWITADWWVYMQSYYHLAFESHRSADFLIQGGHANLLPNIVMTLLVRIFPDVNVVFAVSAVLIGVLPLCVYAFGGVNSLPVIASLCFAVVTMLNPVVVNQSLSSFYGYHPVLFFGPLLLVFFIFREKKNMAGMIITAALSMLVQETVFVFWAGYAVYLALQKKYLCGAALFLFCTSTFLFISYWLMPELCGAGNNVQMFHYTKLGSTPFEVLLSPFLRPYAFWEIISAKTNFYFLLAVLMPCGLLALRTPSMLVIILPLLAGVLLQESPDMKNPAMQYGYEFTVLLIAMSVTSAGKMYREQRMDILCRSIGVVLAMTLLCTFYYGQIPFSRYSSERIFNFADHQEFHDMVLKKIVPENSRVIASDVIQPYYLFKRRIAPLSAELRPGDCVILDVKAPSAIADRVRRRLLADRRAVPVFSYGLGDSCFAIWTISERVQERPVFMPCMTYEDFSRKGQLADTGNSDFSLIVVREGNGTAVHCRVNKSVDYDVEIILQLQYPDGEFSKKILFGNGIYPAWNAEPGTVFSFVLGEPFSGKYHVSLLPIRIEK